MDLGVIFLTGLTVGGLTCAAVQGGLLASAVTSHHNKFWPTAFFIAAKLVGYMLVGFLLGSFGANLQLSPTTTVIMQVIAGVYMVIVALDLLKVHPVFRYAIIQPPRFIYRFLKDESKSKELFAPALLGFLTILIPCGTTLAMESLAVVSGSGLLGAAIMGAFILGTTPLFLGIGMISSRLSGTLLKLAAFVVIYLGLSSINGALVYANSPVTFQTILANSPIQIDLDGSDSQDTSGAPIVGGVQTASVTVLPNGYSPRYISLRQDVPAKITLNTTGQVGCTSVFRIPQLGITKRLPLKGSTEISFTPTTTGKLTWTCGMGMYSGVFDVKGG